MRKQCSQPISYAAINSQKQQIVPAVKLPAQSRTQSLFMGFGGERRLGARLRRAGLMGADEGKIPPRASTSNQPQGAEDMCLSLEHQNLSKTSEKMGYFDNKGLN